MKWFKCERCGKIHRAICDLCEWEIENNEPLNADRAYLFEKENEKSLHSTKKKEV